MSHYGFFQARQLRAARLVASSIFLLLVESGCGGESTKPAQDPAVGDVSAPTVSLVQPVDGAGVTSANATVQGQAADNVGVVRVTSQLNGGSEQTVTTGTGASVNLNFTVSGLQSGSNSIQIHAYDAASNRGSATRSINYSPPPSADTTPPALTINEPVNGAIVTAASVAVQGQATDNIGVTRIAFRLNGAAEQTVAVGTGASVGLNFVISGLLSGLNTVEIRAYDAAGNPVSATRTVTYTPPPGMDTTPPTVALAQPPDGANVTVDTVTFQGQAIDNIAVTRAGFQLNGAAEQAVTIAPGSSVNLNFSVSGLRSGTNTIVVNVYDAAGNRGMATRSVNRTPSPPPGTLAFTRRVIDTASPNNPWMKNIADLDGDGLPDLIVAGDGAGLVWYRAPTWTRQTIAAVSNSESGSAVGDIDGDGDIDIVIGTRWYENVNNATSWVVRNLGSGGTHDIVINDFDGDGKQDVAMRSESSTSIVVFFQNTKDNWTRVALNPGAGLNGLAAGDLTGDGRPDLVVGSRWGENPGGTAARTASAWTWRTLGAWDEFAAVKLADVNKDGRVDVVLSVSEGVGPLSWFEAPTDARNGTWIERRIANGLDHVHGFALVDVNRDGNLDIIASEYAGPGRLIVYLNDGTSRNWTAQVVGNDALHNISVADIGADGDFDVFGVTAFGVNPVILYENTSSAVATRVLVYSRTLGFRHASIADGVRAISQLGAQNGFVVDATEDANAFTGGNLARYRALVFLNVSGDILDTNQRAAFQQYIRAGGGFVGVHNPTAFVLEDWGWFTQLVGTRFSSEIATQPMSVQVLNSTHTSTQGMPDPWRLTTEAYNFTVNPRTNGVTVLLNLDEQSVQGGTMGADHPFSWYHNFDGGRSWYTVGGAETSDYADVTFLRHLLGGIRWAGGF